ncbi:MAG: hypothetical protein IRZ08_07900, partial [Frankia sp.]|nr:hypothetical protein [Frankia sp.]
TPRVGVWGGGGGGWAGGGAPSAEAAADQLAARAAEVRAEDIELAERLSLAAYRLAPTDAASRAMLESFTAGWHSELPAVEPATYRGVALSPGADRAAAIDTAGTLRLWDTSSPFAPTELATVPVADASSVVFLPSGELVIGGNAAATVWDVGDPANPRQIASLDTEASDSHLVAVSGDGSELVTAGSDRRLDVWDMSDPSQPVWLQLSISGAVPTDIALSPSGNVLAVAGVNGSIELWDLTEPTSPRRAGTATGHVGPVNAVAFIADDRLASGGDDSSVRVWDVANPASPAQVTQLRGHDGSVVAVAETASGSALVSAGHDGTLLGWDLSGDAPSPDPVVIKEAGDPFVLAAADDSAWVLLAAAETPDLPKLGSLDPATLAEQACQDPRVRISEQEWSEVTDLPYRDPCQ